MITDEQKEQLAAHLRAIYKHQLEMQQKGNIQEANKCVIRVSGFLFALEALGIKGEIFAMARRKDNGSEQLALDLQ